MSKIYKFILGITVLFTFILLFTSIYTINKSYATITFDVKVINSKASHVTGQLYYSPSNIYHKDLMKSFILSNKRYDQYQTVEIAITHKNITSIRLDPLPNAGEVIVRDFSISQGSLFNKKIQHIDLSKINIDSLKDIKIIKKTKNFLHLKSFKSDPHMEITNKVNLSTSIIDYAYLIKIFVLSLIVTIFILSIIYALIKNFICMDDIIIAILLLTYSMYTILFSNRDFIFYLNIGLPLLGTYIIYKQGFKNYLNIFANIFIILVGLSITIFISDYANNLNQINGYIQFLPYMLLSMLLSIVFIHKTSFNTYFYKYFLLLVTLTMGILSIILHYDIILIDRITVFGYRMSMSEWTQKNYSFFYLFLLWSTISFFHLHKIHIKEIFIIFFLILISSLALLSGYSDSAKLAFIVSLAVYILFSIINFKSKVLLLIPILISLYILFTPLIMDILIYIAEKYPQFSAGRESIYTLSTSLVKEKILFGYGYNTSSGLLLHEHLPTSITSLYDFKYLPGRNPHNIPMLIWLNFGLLGASLFSLLIYFSMKKFILFTYNHNNQPALLALISTFIIITTFSWSGWWQVVFLTYSFFIGLVFLGMNNHDPRSNSNKK